MLVCLPQYLRPWLLLRVFLPNFKAPSLPYLRHGNELTDIIVSLEHSSQFLRSGLLYYNGEELFQWESWKDHEIKISSIAPMKNCLSGTKQILCLPEWWLMHDDSSNLGWCPSSPSEKKIASLEVLKESKCDGVFWRWHAKCKIAQWDLWRNHLFEENFFFQEFWGHQCFIKSWLCLRKILHWAER